MGRRLPNTGDRALLSTREPERALERRDLLVKIRLAIIFFSAGRNIVSGCIGIFQTVNSQQSTVNNHSGYTGIDLNQS